MLTEKWVSSGTKLPLQLLEEQERFRACCFLFGEDGGRKTAGKETKV